MRHAAAQSQPGRGHVLRFLVSADHGNYQAEANETNNVGASGPVTITFGNRPDLVVTGLDVSATPAMESGASVTVSWSDLNDGPG